MNGGIHLFGASFGGAFITSPFTIIIIIIIDSSHVMENAMRMVNSARYIRYISSAANFMHPIISFIFFAFLARRRGGRERGREGRGERLLRFCGSLGVILIYMQ